jgi:hypothetical protein
MKAIKMTSSDIYPHFNATILWFPASVDHYILTFYRVAEKGILYTYIHTYRHKHTHTYTHDNSIFREGII